MVHRRGHVGDGLAALIVFPKSNHHRSEFAGGGYGRDLVLGHDFIAGLSGQFVDEFDPSVDDCHRCSQLHLFGQ